MAYRYRPLAAVERAGWDYEHFIQGMVLLLVVAFYLRNKHPAATAELVQATLRQTQGLSAPSTQKRLVGTRCPGGIADLESVAGVASAERVRFLRDGHLDREGAHLDHENVDSGETWCEVSGDRDVVEASD